MQGRMPLAVRVTSTFLVMSPPLALAAQSNTPTAAEARAFIAQAETELSKAADAQGRAEWVQSTYLTDDTDWLAARADAEATALSVSFAKQAARFDHTRVDAVARRKLDLLKRQMDLPAPSRAGAAQELADVAERLSHTYSTAKFMFNSRRLTLDDAEDLLRTARDPAVTRALWEGWYAASGPPMKPDYEHLVRLTDEGARELGYSDTGAFWRSWYDMPPEQFSRKLDALFGRVKPLYVSLHCYVRSKLNERYGSAVQPATGPIRADLLGNMWGQEWGNIYDIVAPAHQALGYDLTAALVAHGYDAKKLVQVADRWYQSIGFPPEPVTFWERSLFTRPMDREVVCHPSAWDVDQKEDLRLKACLTVTADDFYTVHHELGHNMYQRAYAGQSFLFRDGANDGFHEAIGDFAALNAMTPAYLKQLGLIDQVPGADADIPYLLRMALDKVAFLPFGLLVDKWRWEVFSGQ